MVVAIVIKMEQEKSFQIIEDVLPFWKRPINVRNKVETRAQLTVNTKVTRNY